MNLLEFSSLADSEPLRLFQQVALEVYRADPVWVAQSEGVFRQRLAAANSTGGPRMHAVVVLADGSPLGRPLGRPQARAAALLPAAGAHGETVQGSIGFFECLAGCPEAGRLALQHCEDWLRARGVTSVQAPRVDNMLMGLLVDGFELPQTVLTPHNPPYYLDIFTGQGYQIHERLLCYLLDRASAPRMALGLPGFRTRTFERARLEDEIRLLNELQTEIFRSHPGYVPRSLAEDRAMVESFLPMLDDELVIIAEDARARPVGILICLPDVYQAYQGQAVDRARLISIGALPRLAQRGIGVLMAMHLARNLLAKGYQTLEASWIRESNLPPQNMLRRFKGRKGREFVILEKRIDGR